MSVFLAILLKTPLLPVDGLMGHGSAALAGRFGGVYGWVVGDAPKPKQEQQSYELPPEVPLAHEDPSPPARFDSSSYPRHDDGSGYDAGHCDANDGSGA